ncbi:hypothetical protein TNCV_2097241 [Trichonephila clavipes]|nr:hypothetical protein TNCV_2097241 [Trichonephila clavipes]
MRSEFRSHDIEQQNRNQTIPTCKLQTIFSPRSPSEEQAGGVYRKTFTHYCPAQTTRALRDHPSGRSSPRHVRLRNRSPHSTPSPWHSFLGKG